MEVGQSTYQCCILNPGGLGAVRHPSAKRNMTRHFPHLTYDTLQET